jgi:hypothetical protein
MRAALAYRHANPDRFDKLITALRTAVDNDGTLDKECTSYNDITSSITFKKELIKVRYILVCLL